MHTVQRCGLLLPMFRDLSMCVFVLVTKVVLKSLNQSRCCFWCVDSGDQGTVY